MPRLEHFEDSKKLLVMNVVVDFSARKGARMKSEVITGIGFGVFSRSGMTAGSNGSAARILS